MIKKGFYVKFLDDINRLNGSEQKGKNNTIYITTKNPSSIKEVKKKAKLLRDTLNKLFDKNPELNSNKKYSIYGDKKVPGDTSGRLFYRYDGEKVGPGNNDHVGYRSNDGKYNIPGNEDIF